jgi:aminopeptidase N
MASSNGTATATEPAKHVEKFRKDYTPVPYTVDTISMNFVLNEGTTRVESCLRMKPNTAAGTTQKSDLPSHLFLDGREDVKLVSLKINDAPVSVDHYKVDCNGLSIDAAAIPSGEWDLHVVTHIKPEENTLLEGLYKSGGSYCTQCEAEGFRGITYFLDRPDVMAKYSVRIEADKKKYPVLLSNGNLKSSGDLSDGRHFTVWEDPFRKPCYLFALVAGDLAVYEDTYKTAKSGKQVSLRIFVEHKNSKKVKFAMESLKRAMKWDEDTFGLEYDLDLFNIVAVDDFNMGAMENKSLNIFNSRLVLATPDTATDGDFARIEGVVGHEYFHNYTGNRVTCRDWFQLTLKEGLTVYRDQEFSADMNSRAVKRIEDAVRLRAAQFSEDAGPMAHPIRPESYIKMDNFYTLTVYEKGAEVVRLYEAFLGKEGFRKGMDLYFQRHDGHAVTCADFRAAMADANGEDLAAMDAWYSQAGTPILEVSSSYNPSDKTFTLTFRQHTPPTPRQPSKGPVPIPVRAALLGVDGSALSLRLQGVGNGAVSHDAAPQEMVLRVTEAEQSFVFVDIADKPVPSLLRGFSAPVKMKIEGQTEDDLTFLLANDTDPFNRWDAGQVLAKNLLKNLYEKAAEHLSNGKARSVENVNEALNSAGGVRASLVEAYRAVLADQSVDGQFKAFAMSLPSDSELVDSIPDADPTLLHDVRLYVIRELAARLRPELEAVVKENDDSPGTPYDFNAAACARRALKNKALGYLASLKDASITEELQRRFKEATNMTDEIAALAALDVVGGPAREESLNAFYSKWQSEPLVLLKWLALSAGSNQSGNLPAVKQLVDHPAFNMSNPNSCYSLFLSFARSPVNFHAVDGSGYEFMGDAVLRVDKVNRQVAARMVGVFTTWRQYDAPRQAAMRSQLQRIVATDGISENVFEIASKALEAASS